MASHPAPDLSEFEAHVKHGRGPQCSVALARKDLKGKPTKLRALDAALATERITGSAIARTLTDWEIPISAISVQRHRRKECTCDRA